MSSPRRAQSQEGGVVLLVCSPVRLYREGLAAVLERERGLSVAGAFDANECLNAVEDVGPDMVLLDTTAPDALALTPRLTGLRHGPRVVALGLPEEERIVVAYAEAGVSAYVTREDSIEDLLAVLHAAARGEARCSSRTAGILLRRVATLAAERRVPRPAAPAVHLTRRELEIAELVNAGLSNKQIAHRLQIELPTVKNHVHHILEKLDVGRRGEAAAVLRGSGVLRVPEAARV